MTNGACRSKAQHSYPLAVMQTMCKTQVQAVLDIVSCGKIQVDLLVEPLPGCERKSRCVVNSELGSKQIGRQSEENGLCMGEEKTEGACMDTKREKQDVENMNKTMREVCEGADIPGCRAQWNERVRSCSRKQLERRESGRER